MSRRIQGCRWNRSLETGCCPTGTQLIGEFNKSDRFLRVDQRKLGSRWWLCGCVLPRNSQSTGQFISRCANERADTGRGRNASRVKGPRCADTLSACILQRARVVICAGGPGRVGNGFAPRVFNACVYGARVSVIAEKRDIDDARPSFANGRLCAGVIQGARCSCLRRSKAPVPWNADG